MSEYQYYEFQAIDRSLSEAEREALRELSTRARITATSFTNHYEWGDFKGDPKKLMERWFDLHLYLANWGTRQLMIRLPKRLVDRRLLDAFLGEVENVTLWTAGDNLILNIVREEVEAEDWDDGSGWLAALAPLRADVLGGDLRVFYLVWLMAVQADVFEPDEPEPMPGIGPLTSPLEAFADFFGIDRDLVAAAAERAAGPATQSVPSKEARPIIAAMTDQEKTGFLVRLFEGDAHGGSELRALVRDRVAPKAAPPPVAARTVGELQARANALRLARGKAQAAKAAAERNRREEEAERARLARLGAIERRGESVWQEIEAEIERRNSTGYDKAAALLADLRTIAETRGSIETFTRRLETIRERHGRKERFIERLAKLR